MAPPPRKILHLDLDAFFCAVEEQYDPTLRGKAFAVGGSPEGRGVVASCSYAARQFGVHSAMPMAAAVRRCPHLIRLPWRRGVYSQVSQAVMARLHNLTPLVEQISIDEAFLDASDLAAPVAQIAHDLQMTIRNELDLPCSLGAAANKLVAKIANDVGKSRARGSEPPNAITIVPPGEERAFLAPLPTQALWGVGPKMAQQLAALGMHTIGDIAAWPPQDLARRFGKHGQELAQRARGEDDRPVIAQHEVKSISKEVTFAHDIANGAELRRTLRGMAAEVGQQLRDQGLHGGVVKIKLRWPDFTTITRQSTLPRPTNLDEEIAAAGLALFARAWQPGQLVRLIGIGVSGLGQGYRQLSLWDVQNEQKQRLQDALDTLRHRFGRDVVVRGADLVAEKQG